MMQCINHTNILHKTLNAISASRSFQITCFCSWLSWEDMDSRRIRVCWSSSCAAPTRWLLLSADWRALSSWQKETTRYKMNNIIKLHCDSHLEPLVQVVKLHASCKSKLSTKTVWSIHILLIFSLPLKTTIENKYCKAILSSFPVLFFAIY